MARAIYHMMVIDDVSSSCHDSAASLALLRLLLSVNNRTFKFDADRASIQSVSMRLHAGGNHTTLVPYVIDDGGSKDRPPHHQGPKAWLLWGS